MPTEEGSWEILAGETVTAESTVTIIAAGSSGSPGTFRTLTHPLSGTFPEVTYSRNPDRTINFDQVPLFPPTSQTVRTLGTTEAFVTPNSLSDVIVTEIWEGGGNRASMTAAMFRRLYEMIINPPDVASPEVFIRWAPRDRTMKVYNVILLDLRVGGSPGKLDVKEIGLFDAGVVDEVATGILDRGVELDLKLVSEYEE